MKKGLSFEIIIFSVFCFISITHWVNNFRLSPDSTNYVVAAANFLKTSSFFVFTNWPSFSLAPAVEPYYAQAPGFPLYVGAYLILFRDVTVAMLMAQIGSIILLYLAVLLLTKNLGFNTYFKVITLFFITFLFPFKLIFSHLWTEPLLIALTLVTLCISNGVSRDKMWHRKYWSTGILFLILSSLLKYIGAFNIAFFVAPVFNGEKKKKTRYLLLVLAAFLPIGLWFIRNIALLQTTIQQPISTSFNYEMVLRPLFLQYDLLGVAKPLNVLIWVCFVAAIYFPFYFNKFHLNEKLTMHLNLILGFAAHAFGIYILSIFIMFDPLDARLTILPFTLGIFVLLNGLFLLKDRIVRKEWRWAFLLLPWFFMLTSKSFDINQNVSWEVNYPKEREVWKHIFKQEQFKNSSHFYSDLSFIHQVYAGIPQRIIWEKDSVATVDQIRELLTRGRSPFFLLDKGSDLHRLMEAHRHRVAFLQKEESMEQYGYILYYKQNSSF
jgi:hypothetical protein